MLSSYINQSFRNLLINGGHGIAQRWGEPFTSGLNTVPSFYFFDRWGVFGSGALATGFLQVTDPIGGPGLTFLVM